MVQQRMEVRVLLGFCCSELKPAVIVLTAPPAYSVVLLASLGFWEAPCQHGTLLFQSCFSLLYVPFCVCSDSVVTFIHNCIVDRLGRWPAAAAVQPWCCRQSWELGSGQITSVS